VQGDGPADEGRVEAPQRGEPVGAQPRQHGDRDDVGQREQAHVAIRRDHQRPTGRHDVQADDEDPVGQADRVREVVRADARGGLVRGQRRRQHARDGQAQREEPAHRTPSSPGALGQHHDDRRQGRQHDEGEDEVGPHRGPAQARGDVALESPPDEGLVDLVQPEQQRQRRDRGVLRATLEVPAGVDADGGDDQSADEVTGR
jgi:hypothetical protein